MNAARSSPREIVRSKSLSSVDRHKHIKIFNVNKTKPFIRSKSVSLVHSENIYEISDLNQDELVEINLLDDEPRPLNIVTNNDLLKSFDDLRKLNKDTNTTDKKVNIELLKLSYINHILKFKNYIRSEKIFYTTSNHKRYNSHLTTNQYWILNDIKTRYPQDNVIINYLKSIQSSLKNNNSICFTYVNFNLDVYLYDFILIIDHKINIQATIPNMTENPMFYPEGTYVSLISCTEINRNELYPMTILKDIPSILIKNKIELNTKEILTLFEDAKYRKISISNNTVKTIDIYLFSIYDFIMIDFNNL